MKFLYSRIRSPVKREGSENYLIITLMSFGISVGLTRLFLEITGYPQLGNSELHIAHVLWGGLLLFIASLLPLIFANRWVYTLGALLAGVGIGLFIDEVGKFITQTNDYFYPPAAPIIYAFFLLTVLLYIQVRRPPPRDPRTELYRSLDGLEEVLDHDLDESERAELEARLRYVAKKAKQPNLAHLAEGLLEFLASESLELAQPTTPFWQRMQLRLADIESRWGSQNRIRAILAGGLGAVGVFAIFKLSEVVRAALSPEHLELLIAEMVLDGRVATASGMNWFSARLALEGSVGILLVAAAGLLLFGQDRHGITVGYVGLLLALTAVNLLVFYFDQFSTIITATIQFSLFLLLVYYRSRYLKDFEDEPDDLDPAG